MNNEELKKKIVEIINDGIIHGEDNFGVPTSKTIESIADALIAAGIGDVKEVEAEANRYEWLYKMQSRDMVLAERKVHEAERKVHEAEHRAEVAERAVYNMAYGEWQREGARRAICEKYAPSTARDYLDRAEKELAEEEKDEQS